MTPPPAADHEDQLQFVKRHLYDMLVLVAAGKSKVCPVFLIKLSNFFSS